MRKLLSLAIITFGFLFLTFPNKASAQDKFYTTATVTYDVLENEITNVTYEITIENKFTDYYAADFKLILDNIDLTDPIAFENDRQIPLSSTVKSGQVILKVDFEDTLVGKGALREFSISFKDYSLVKRTGDVREIYIAKLGKPESFTDYNVVLRVPLSFEKASYIFPKPIASRASTNKINYYFDKNSFVDNGVAAIFGDFQAYSFDITYHLHNPISKTAELTIAIPPDTMYQKVFYNNISPSPKEINVDEDGNWLAVYQLDPQERLDVRATGSIQIYASSRQLATTKESSLLKYTRSELYWESNDPEIIKIAKSLGDARSIYNYVKSTLSYDYNRVHPDIKRMGALGALKNPQNAICMEFTDLFIALARAAGIPAREINGYAYTENPKLQPLSLVADVLHSWPEYWDEDRKTWIPVDPTWEKTTGGVDYFNKLDLKHITFVIHASSSEKPYPPGSYKLGPNPQKDVFVNFIDSPEIVTTTPQIFLKSSNNLPLRTMNYKAEVINPGPTALYDQTIVIAHDNREVDAIHVSVMPPFSKKEIDIKVPVYFLGRGVARAVSVSFANQRIEIPTNKGSALALSISFIFMVIFCLGLGLFFLFKKRS